MVTPMPVSDKIGALENDFSIVSAANAALIHPILTRRSPIDFKGSAVRINRVKRVERSSLHHARILASRLVSAILFVLTVAPARAQTIIEEVMVTAQKRAQAAQDVGITISVYSGDELGRLNVQHEAEVVANIPNVQVNYGFGRNAFNIRGLRINEFSANLDSPVAVHVDEVYKSKNFMTTMLLFDIEQVEALKGPQGTLFGRNTTGSSINFSTRKPTEKLAAGVTIGFDNYQILRGEFFAGGPIGENLRGRLSSFVTDQDKGFYRNLTRDEREGAEQKYALRGQLAWSNCCTNVLGSVEATVASRSIASAAERARVIFEIETGLSISAPPMRER